MQHGMQFQQRFVYTSQFLRAEILVIDSATHTSIINEGQRAYCIEQVMVSNFADCKVGDCFPREEEAIQSRDNKLSVRVKEDVAVLRDEQHEQPVDKPQYLPVVVLCV